MKEQWISSFRTRDMVRCSLFTVLIIIGTFTKIPIYVVPFTLQFLFTNMAVLMLGKKGAAVSVGLYILLGLIGLPVFTRGGGISYVLHPTFGYILGFLLGAYLAGAFIEKMGKRSFGVLLAASLINLAAVYLLGITHYYWIAKVFLTPVDLLKIIWTGALIFLPVDFASALLGVLIALRISPQPKN